MKYSGAGATVLAVLLLATPAGAQFRAFPDVTTLVGPGSSIGVRVRDLSEEELNTAKLDSTGGVYIEEVLRDTPAERAGFKSGDIVTEFDGERIRSVRGFTRVVSETPPRRKVKAVVVREGSRQTIEVAPEVSRDRLTRDLTEAFPRNFPRDFPQLRTLPRLQDSPRFNVAPSAGRLGVTLNPIDGQLADYFGVTDGALVSAVDRDSPAARAGVRAGDVIVAVNGRSVRRPGEVGEAVRTAGNSVELKVMRDKKEMTLRVTLRD
jgi:serine protease Do